MERKRRRNEYIGREPAEAIETMRSSTKYDYRIAQGAADWWSRGRSTGITPDDRPERLSSHAVALLPQTICWVEWNTGLHCFRCNSWWSSTPQWINNPLSLKPTVGTVAPQFLSQVRGYAICGRSFLGGGTAKRRCFVCMELSYPLAWLVRVEGAITLFLFTLMATSDQPTMTA